MAGDDFTAEGLLDAGVERYGQGVLRERMRGAQASVSAADDELFEIAESVFARVRTAAAATVSWPFPGTDDESTAYREKWPANILQRALELFNWRTLTPKQTVTEEQRRIGKAAEDFFNNLEKGILSWGIGGTTDVSAATITTARTRDGSSLLPGLLSPTSGNLLDSLRGPWWDRA